MKFYNAGLLISWNSERCMGTGFSNVEMISDDVKDVRNFMMTEFEKDQNVWSEHSPAIVVKYLNQYS